VKADWEWEGGNWRDLVSQGLLTDLGFVPFEDIGAPWARNIHSHLNYDRLFWSVRNEGLKTPLLLRGWEFPFRGNRVAYNCKPNGDRMDNIPAVTHKESPKYELVIGNMRWCAAYICGYEIPCLLLPEDEQSWLVEDLWTKYHPIFEGTKESGWYSHPDHGGPSKGNITFIQ